MEVAGCLACFLTSSNTPTSCPDIATVAWPSYRQRSMKKSSNLPKRRQRNWKKGVSRNWRDNIAVITMLSLQFLGGQDILPAILHLRADVSVVDFAHLLHRFV